MGKGACIDYLFDEMKRLAGFPRDPVHGPPRSGDAFSICLDARKAKRELGWSPTVGFQEGLQRTLAYFREQLAITERPALAKSNLRGAR